MGEVSDHNRLWVSLSALGDGNVFAVLPELMKQMFAEDNMVDSEDGFSDVILPSDHTWQSKIYYQLVERQRMADSKPEYDETLLEPVMRKEKMMMHEWNILPRPSTNCQLRTDKSANVAVKSNAKGPSIVWTVSDIAKAGCLLSSPPIETNFEDEQEMRRVYTMIYDVFRYKNVLMQALNDVKFFQIFPKLISVIAHVWLLFYDLYHRSFKKRETNVAQLAFELFDKYGLSYTENALWTQKVKLAASVARLRIKHNALSLSELLPSHLKDERVTEQAKNNPVTCWINSLMMSDVKSLFKDIEDTFNLKIVSDVEQVCKNSFKWDRHCPQIIAFHASMRSKLARSKFVKEHILVVQDKSFCLGPATFDKLINELELTGSVIQTHVNSPRTTAYLATLLHHNEKIKKLIAFSAGKRKTEYEAYFSQLGMSNIVIYSDRLIDAPADASYMEEVVAIFATPPNSYSAVADPIDLVCSRGGDLSMLEVLTESSDTKEARERVASILEEQKKTLRFAMSRPQIQFVLYETHSELDAENSLMVKNALRDINMIAKVQHATLQGKVVNCGIGDGNSEDTDVNGEINNNEDVKIRDQLELENKHLLESEGFENMAEDKKRQLMEIIKVPETDVFDTQQLPKLCGSEICDNFEKAGCYLALLQRKQIIRLDNKYMIQMAEHRGLFGSTSSSNMMKTKSGRTMAKKQQQKNELPQKSRKNLKDAEIARIAAPTHTFLMHTRPLEEVDACKKCGSGRSTVYTRWWKQTTRHILFLNKTFAKQRTGAPIRDRNDAKSKAIVDSFLQNVPRIDEFAHHCRTNHHTPIVPKLKLKRDVKLEKHVPLTVTNMEFPLRQSPILLHSKT